MSNNNLLRQIELEAQYSSLLKDENDYAKAVIKSLITIIENERKPNGISLYKVYKKEYEQAKSLIKH